MTDGSEDLAATDRDEVFRLVQATLADVLAVPRARVSPRARLAGDLHADSLDLVEAVEAVEQALRDRGHRLRVPEAAVAAWHTVGDAVDSVLAALGKSPERSWGQGRAERSAP